MMPQSNFWIFKQNVSLEYNLYFCTDVLMRPVATSSLPEQATHLQFSSAHVKPTLVYDSDCIWRDKSLWYNSSKLCVCVTDTRQFGQAFSLVWGGSILYYMLNVHWWHFQMANGQTAGADGMLILWCGPGWADAGPASTQIARSLASSPGCRANDTQLRRNVVSLSQDAQTNTEHV